MAVTARSSASLVRRSLPAASCGQGWRTRWARGRLSGQLQLTGFTLLELMLAMMLGSLILTVVYSTFSAGIDTQRRVGRVAGETQAWRFFTERLRTDIKNLVLGEHTLRGDGRQLTLHSVLPGKPLREISYRYKRSTDGGEILRRQRTPESNSKTEAQTKAEADGSTPQKAAAGKAYETLVFDGVERLSFRYLIEGQWRDRVDPDDAEALPQAIECTVQETSSIRRNERRLVIAVEVRHEAG